MPKIFPFRALRPTRNSIEHISAKSTDFPKKEDLVHEIQSNKLTFHHVTKSHLSYNGAYQEPEKFLPFASQYIQRMKQDGHLIVEDKPCIYIYKQIRKDGTTFDRYYFFVLHKRLYSKQHKKTRRNKTQ